MKFDYKKDAFEAEVVAELFHMDDKPDQICLNIYHTTDHVTTVYYDGQVFNQPVFNTGICSIKKFYKGDSITITF